MDWLDKIFPNPQAWAEQFAAQPVTAAQRVVPMGEPLADRRRGLVTMDGHADTKTLGDRLFAEFSRAHRRKMAWVMNLDWYKQCRRTAASHPDGEQDEAKWVPSPDDLLFALPVVVRDDGGEPHIEWLTPEEIGR